MRQARNRPGAPCFLSAAKRARKPGVMISRAKHLTISGNTCKPTVRRRTGRRSYNRFLTILKGVPMPVSPPRPWLGSAVLALSGLVALPAVQAQQLSAVDARAIWPERSLSACRTAQAEAVDACLLRTMQKGGARPQAIAAAKALAASGNPGFISAWRPVGKASIATVTYPFRANTNQGSLLVGSDGVAVDIDADLLSDADRATDTWS